MGSFNGDSDVSGEEMRNLTLQWDYRDNPSRKRQVKEREDKRNRAPRKLPAAINGLICMLFMIAGLATTTTLVGVLTGWINIENLL